MSEKQNKNRYKLSGPERVIFMYKLLLGHVCMEFKYL